jgi:hypothetical protein
MAVLSMSDEELRRLEVVRDVDRGVCRCAWQGSYWGVASARCGGC